MNISSQKQKLIVYAVLTVAIIAVFWQVNNFDFVNLDDSIYVTENSHIRSGLTPDGISWAFTTRYFFLWHPLVWLSFMFDHQIHGLDPGGYHLTNLILHILSTWLLFWLFDRMTGAVWKSAFVAAFFGLHPLHVESVVWIAERKDVLSAFFWMLTLCLYVYYTEKPGIRRYLPVLFAFICACLSKAMVVTLPVVMILLDYWPLKRFELRGNATTSKNAMPATVKPGKKKDRSKKGKQKEDKTLPNKNTLPESGRAKTVPLRPLWDKAPFFILSAILIVITLCSPENPDALKNFPLGSRIANAVVSFVVYLERTFWPRDMAIFYPFPAQIPLWQILLCSFIIVAVSATAVITIKRHPWFFTGWMWYAITILPVIGILQIWIYAMADHYHYLPSIGISFALVWGVPSFIKNETMRKAILFPAAILILAVMSFFTWRQCSYWKNSITLFSHATQVTKDNFIAHGNIAPLLYEKGKTEEAIYHYNEAIRAKPDYADAYSNRGNAYHSMGKDQLAIDDYNEAIRLKPHYADAYYNRGTVYLKHGQYQNALEDFTKAIRFKDNYADAYNNRGIIYVYLNRHQNALEDFNCAIRIKDNYAGAYNNRAFVYLNSKNIEQGCSDARKACGLGDCSTFKSAVAKGFCH